MELDSKDKRILLELDLNAKASAKELAKKVKLSKEAVLYRIKKLEEAGILKGYIAATNFSMLGYTGFGVFCRLEGADEKKKAEITQYLKEFPQVYWIGLYAGRFDISFGVMCRSVAEFNRLHYRFKNDYSEFISETQIAIRADLRQFTRNYMIKDERARQKTSLSFGKEPENAQIDELDSKILSEISQNARLPIVEVASRLGKPATTIALRIKKLEQRGIIEGYDTQVKVQNYGMQSYRLLMALNKMDEAMKGRLFSYAQENHRIWLAGEIVGAWNFEIVIEAESQEIFEKELSGLKKLFGSAIGSMDVLIIFDEDHYLNMWPFGKEKK